MPIPRVTSFSNPWTGDPDGADTQRRVLYDWRSYLASFDAQITVVPATYQSADRAIHRSVLCEVDRGDGDWRYTHSAREIPKSKTKQRSEPALGGVGVFNVRWKTLKGFLRQVERWMLSWMAVIA